MTLMTAFIASAWAASVGSPLGYDLGDYANGEIV
jgi:hypothetical protein